MSHDRELCLPVLGTCTVYAGKTRCNKPVAYRTYAPDGHPVPGAYKCEDHARAIHDEYLAKLGEDWPIKKLHRYDPNICPKGEMPQ